MKPQRPTTHSSYRRINKIDVQNFRADIKQTGLFRNFEQMDPGSFVSAYKDELRTLLDKHAPLVYRKSKTIRMNRGKMMKLGLRSPVCEQPNGN